jgi:hypothetical protein
MSPADSESNIDATPTVVRTMRRQALGLLFDGLLRSPVRSQFESLIETTADRASIPSKAGSLLVGQADNLNFVDRLANDLVENLEVVFWVEMSEHLIRNTTCKFNGFGEFRRYASKVSFITEFLWENPTVPRILHESNDDLGYDALCRFVMQTARPEAHIWFETKFKDSDSTQAFPLLAGEILRWGLPQIMGVLSPSAPYAATVFSSVCALGSYYAWIIAFDTLIQNGFVSVLGVGSFALVAATTGDRVDFSIDGDFSKLITINAERPPLPDELSPPSQAAA